MQPFVDHYETLQISPNADLDTIHRVYRILAQRFHPDNAETGDSETFRALIEGYRVLSDPEKRAAFDIEHRATRRVICEPSPVSGEEVAARAGARNPYASSRDPYATGSLGAKKTASRPRRNDRINEEDEFEDD